MRRRLSGTPPCGQRVRRRGSSLLASATLLAELACATAAVASAGVVPTATATAMAAGAAMATGNATATGAATATGTAMAMATGNATATGTQSGGSTTPGAKTPASATLEQCVTSTEQAARSATFAGEMTALPGTAKMEMRVDVLERMPQEATFHAVAAPGLGVWRSAAPGVKVYKYLKQVTNLAAPAAYRAAVRFRWLNAKGKLIKASELRTPRCVQPLHPRPAPERETPSNAGTTTGTGGAGA